jgi:hypothetical protein
LQLPQAYIICSLFDKVGDESHYFLQDFYGLHLPGKPQFSYFGLH